MSQHDRGGREQRGRAHPRHRGRRAKRCASMINFTPPGSGNVYLGGLRHQQVRKPVRRLATGLPGGRRRSVQLLAGCRLAEMMSFGAHATQLLQELQQQFGPALARIDRCQPTQQLRGHPVGRLDLFPHRIAGVVIPPRSARSRTWRSGRPPRCSGGSAASSGLVHAGRMANNAGCYQRRSPAVHVHGSTAPDS